MTSITPSGQLNNASNAKPLAIERVNTAVSYAQPKFAGRQEEGRFPLPNWTHSLILSDRGLAVLQPLLKRAGIPPERVNRFALSGLQPTRYRIGEFYPQVYDNLAFYVDRGLRLLKSGNYSETVSYFLKPPSSGDIQWDLQLAAVPIKRIPETMDEAKAMYRQMGPSENMVDQDGVHVHLKIPVFDNPSQNRQQKKILEIINHGIAYACVEEWLHTVQLTYGTYLSEAFRGERFTSDPNHPRIEHDVAQYLLEQGIPVPRNFLEFEPYGRSHNITVPAKYTKHNTFYHG